MGHGHANALVGWTLQGNTARPWAACRRLDPPQAAWRYCQPSGRVPGVKVGRVGCSSYRCGRVGCCSYP